MSLHRWGGRTRLAVAGAAAVALLAGGCSGSGADAEAKEKTLVVYTGQAGDYQINFNPYSPSMIEGPGSIYEPLFFYNVTQDVEPASLLGESFSWNEDGTELSVTVRSDATWSDGKKFTAEDVAFTLDLIAANKTMNSTGYAGEAEAVNDTTVTVKFDEPSFMEEAQILGKIWIVPKHIWKDYDKPAQKVVRKPVGTGAFTLEEFKPQAFTLASNPDYWGGEPELKQIRYLSLSGNQAGADALKAGTIDWQTGPVPDIQNVSENYPGYEAVTVPVFQTVLMTCSSAGLGCKGPQTDPVVRHAIYNALDRKQINSLAFQDTSSAISPGFALPERDEEIVSDKLQDTTAPMKADVAGATDLLEGAGYTKNSKGVYAKNGKALELTVKIPSGWTDYITAVKVMTEQLKKAGIKLTAQQLSWNEWSDARGRGEYELILDSLYPGPAPDPYFAYAYFFSGETTAKVGETANPNFARYENATVDKAITELKKLSRDEAEQRQEQYDAIQAQIEKDMPYIPVLTGGTTSEYHADKFTGWPTEGNLYAFPAVWQRPDQAQIYKNLKPASGE